MHDSPSVSSTTYLRPLTPYADALATWSALGFAVVPAAENKTPALLWGRYSFFARQDEGHHTPTPRELTRWRRDHGAHDAGCLLLDSRPDLLLAVVDVDADDDDLFAWVEATFGVTPLIVTSGRGRHYFYRTTVQVRSRSGMIGPAASFVDHVRKSDGVVTVRHKSPIDVKASAAYTLASGSWHAKRERPYTASAEITEALLQSLPLFDVDLYERQVAETAALRRLSKRIADRGELPDARIMPAFDAAPAPAETSDAPETITPSLITRKIPRERLASVARRAVVVEKGRKVESSVDPDLVVESERHGSITLAELHAAGGGKLRCPFHEGGSPFAAAVFTGSYGDPILRCHSARCNERSWVIGGNGQGAGEAVDEPTADDDAFILGSDEPDGEARAIFDSLAQHVTALPGAEPASTEPRGPGGEKVPKAWTPRPMCAGRHHTSAVAKRRRAHSEQRYMSTDTLLPVEAFPAIFLRAPTGTGKTAVIRAHLDRLRVRLGREPRVISVSHRRTLVAELRERLGLAHTHLNDRGEVEITREKVYSLAVCADSLAGVARQLKATGDGVDVLVLDESESTLAHIHTCQRSPVEKAGIFDALREIARSSGQIIAADAMLSDFSIEGVARLVGLDVGDLLSRAALVEDNRPRAQLSPLDVVWLDRPEDAGIAAGILARDGRPFLYHIGSKARAKAVAAELRAAHPDRVWVLVTGDHDDETGAAFLAGPNVWIREHRGRIGGIVYTAALESGVSLDEPLDPARGDSVIIEAAGHQTAQQVIQAASRSRSARRWFVHAPVHGLARWTDDAELRVALIEGREDSEAGVTKRAGWERARCARDGEQFESYIAARVQVDRSRVNLGVDLWAYLASEGYEIHHPTVSPCKFTRKAQLDRISERRDAIKAAEIDAVVAADDSGLTVEQAEAILDRTLASDDRPAAVKCLVREFYGQEPTREIIEFDDGGKGRSSIARYVDLLALLRGQGGAVADHDGRELVVTGGAAERVRRACVSWAVMELFGVTPEMVAGELVSGRTFTPATGWWDSARLKITPAVQARVWTWAITPVNRGALKSAIGVDPIAQVPKAIRKTVIDAVKAQDFRTLASLTGVDSSKEEPQTRETAPVDLICPFLTPPEGHTLNRLLTAAAAKLGLLVRSYSRYSATKGGTERDHRFDLTRARMIRGLAAAHYTRTTGAELPPVTGVEGEDEMIDRQLEAERVLHREVMYERATQDELDQLVAEHEAEREADVVRDFVTGAPASLRQIRAEEEHGRRAQASYRMWTLAASFRHFWYPAPAVAPVVDPVDQDREQPEPR